MNGAGHRDDPRWREAREELVADMGEDEDPDAAYLRHVNAAIRMYRVEKNPNCRCFDNT